MTGETLQSRIDMIAEPQLSPAPKALSTTVWLPSSLPLNSLAIVKGTDALLVLPYLQRISKQVQMQQDKWQLKLKKPLTCQIV
jgi:hypothetical protein